MNEPTVRDIVLAVEELAKAGMSTADIVNGGLSGVLALARHASLDIVSAVSIASKAMNQFT